MSKGTSGRMKRILIPVGILLVGGLVAWELLKVDKPARGARPKPPVPVVDVVPLEAGRQVEWISAMGTVRPARQTVMASEATGVVVAVAFEWEPGRRVEKGELLVKLDDRDARIEVRRAEADLKKAEADFAIEVGKRDVARAEMAVMAELGVQTQAESLDLVLRTPQRVQAEGDVERARADLEKARLALSRTEIRAPFDAVVTERNATLGTRLAPGSPVATLVGTERFWVEARVPVERLPFIRKGEDGSRATITARNGIRDGRISEILVDLSSESRQARVLARVENPPRRPEDPSPSSGRLREGGHRRADPRPGALCPHIRFPGEEPDLDP